MADVVYIVTKSSSVTDLAQRDMQIEGAIRNKMPIDLIWKALPAVNCLDNLFLAYCGVDEYVHTTGM